MRNTLPSLVCASSRDYTGIIMQTQEVYTRPPVPGKKLSKDAASYVAHGPFGCYLCFWYEQPLEGVIGHCTPVGQPIHRNGCCDYFNDRQAPTGVGKARAEYVYVPYNSYTCKRCTFFDRLSETCWPVEGHIDPDASCNKWMPTYGAYA